MLADVIRERAEGLLQTYRKETTEPLTDVVDVGDVVCWLNRRVREQRLSLTTAKCYRRWLAAYFEDMGHPESAQIRNWIPPGSLEEVLAHDRHDAEQLVSVINVESLETNSRYLAGLDNKGYGALMDQLTSLNAKGEMRYTAGHVAGLMFAATMMTGLRVMEWPTVRFLDSFTDPETMLTLGPVLETHTLKQSNRREDNPLREKRYLVLDSWPETQLLMLKGWVAEVTLAGKDFKSLYNKIRMTVRRAWKRVQKEHDIDDRFVLPQLNVDDEDDESGHGVSLYTARHIFAEEVRRSCRFTRFELAAMLGHSMLTNQVYYGPRDGSSDREFDFALPKPWPGDADDIMRWDAKVNPLRQRFAQGDLFAGPLDDKALEREDKEGVAGFLMR
ncbi:hypothetical protein VQ574_21455 (plasmid) [Stutzerimonas frequens]|uniref:hypothetical protein n=1 Tax=Stutzerimonas frequens TaxID=2968969 RepID=UPI002DC05148|nr:hypothetical protein [Stutzerimonas frequens]WRW29294.1 hypothetical protein VQ574_21455 [Stutzerimonas frequens]